MDVDRNMNANSAAVDIDVAALLKKMRSRWKLITVVAVCSAAVGVALSFTVPKEYTCVAKVAPELALRTNSLTSLASMAGLNMNMLSNNNDALLPTIYPDIVGSVPFITDLFDKPVLDSTLYYYVTKKMRRKSAMSLFKSGENNAAGVEVDSYRLTKKQFSAYKRLKKSIKVEVDKKTFLVTITVKMQDPVVAATLSRYVIDALKAYVTTYRTGKAVQNEEFLSGAFYQARDEYFKSQQRLARYSDAHQEVAIQRAQVERQRLQNEANLNFQLYSSLAQQLQQAQVTVQQEAPVFAVVTPPSVPLRKSGPRRAVAAVVFAFLGVLASCVYIMKKY